MSQQINLFLPELQPKKDWFAFPLVAGALALIVVAMLAAVGVLRLQRSQLAGEEAALQAQLKMAQQQVQQLGTELAARKPDAALQKSIDALTGELKLREEALRIVESGGAGNREGFAPMMRAFSQQALSGVWLTGFVVSDPDFEIRGRMTDPSLLSGYIRRLNSESVFQGRRFAELDIKRESPKNDPTAKAPAPALRYVDFALRAQPEKNVAATAGAAEKTK